MTKSIYPTGDYLVMLKGKVRQENGYATPEEAAALIASLTALRGVQVKSPQDPYNTSGIGRSILHFNFTNGSSVPRAEDKLPEGWYLIPANVQAPGMPGVH